MVLSTRPAGVAAWIWLGPVAFLAHDAEEIATVAPWLRAHGAALPPALHPFTAVTTAQFAAAVAVLFVGFVAAAAHGAWQSRRGTLSLPFVVVAGTFVANGLTHLAQAAYFGGYVPGLVTATVVNLPYGYGLARTLHGGGLASVRGLWAALAAGAVLQAPVALLALAAARGWP